MNLNTIAEVTPARLRRRDRGLAAELRVAGRRHLALLRAAGRHRHADRPRFAGLDAAHRDGRTGSRSPRPAGWPTCTPSRARPTGRPVPLFRNCIDAFLMSFKIWNAATIGGNIVHVAAGRRHDLAHGGAGGRLHPVAARRRAPDGSGRRLRHRQPQERPAAGRAAALDPPARVGARPSASPCARCRLTHLGRSAALIVGDRQRRRNGLPPDHYRRDAAADSPALRRARRRRPNCAGRSTSSCPPMATSRTSTARPPTSGTSPITSPNRSARNWHEQVRGQRPSLRGRAARRASACAPSCATSKCSASRRAATPATAAPARSGSTASRSTPAWCPPSAPRAQDHDHRGPRHGRRDASRSRRPSTTRRPSSAASAPPA